MPQALLGITRFDDLRRDLGISRKVLSERLERLVSTASWNGTPTPSTLHATTIS